MKKINKVEAASYCCEASDAIDIEKLIEVKAPIKKIEKVEAASYCCEASTSVDIQKLIDKQ